MKRFALAAILLLSLGFLAQAGPEMIGGKEMKQVVPVPCDEWYRDTEWNVSIWGTYLFTGENWEEDEYVESDHAWGGGIDVKYFFHRYFGVGLEGWAVDAQRERLLGETVVGNNVVDVFDHERRAIGAVKATFTLRYPFHCSRFAPYLFGGAGVIFGGGERDILEFSTTDGPPALKEATHEDGDPEFVGQIGAGFEVRITRHIGIINDFSWNFVGEDKSDFGMVRNGVNFSF